VVIGKGEGAVLGVNLGHPMGTLLRSCAKVREPIELSFWVVNGVSLGIRVLDGIQVPQGEGAASEVFQHNWFQWHIFRTEMYSTRA